MEGIHATGQAMPEASRCAAAGEKGRLAARRQSFLPPATFISTHLRGEAQPMPS